MKTLFLIQWALLSLTVAVAETTAPSRGSATPLVVAHRGASKQAPENTIPAFHLAWTQGADAIEGDFHLTKDGHIVCIHDANTKRTAGRELIVAQSTLAELRALDVGAWFGAAFKGTSIPTLDEVLATIPEGRKIFIEIKCGPEIIPALLESIQQSGLTHNQVVVISFHEKLLKELKVRSPGLKTSWLVSFKKDDNGVIIPSFDSVLKTLTEIKSDGFSSGQHHIAPAWISRVKAKGIEHHVWTIDDPRVAKRFQKLGTKSITTNVPADILDAFADYPVITSSVLSSDALKRYVEQFNAVDVEEGVNTIHNKDAYGFLLDNIPLFECPDEDFKRTYYYRWWTYRKHLRNTTDGWVVTEFYPNVGWAKKNNTINCPVGHQIYEGRWLRDATYLKDYIAFHFTEGGNPGGESKGYSNWLTDAIYAHYLVTGDKAFVTGLLHDLIVNHRAYSQDGTGNHSQSRYLEDLGLYWQIDSWDGSEFSIGGSGVRPSMNSYLYGNAVAIANIADLAGTPAVAMAYRQEAETLKLTIQSTLWDADAKFFKVLRDPRAKANYPNSRKENCEPGNLVTVRELYGYAPWYFNMPDAGKGYEEAWAQLSDPQGFKGEYGPGFAERRHPNFFLNNGGCVWAGSSWPLATSQTLTALANVLNNYEQDVIGKQDYFDTLRAYTRSHQLKVENGSVVPWIDESLNQDTGRWIMAGFHPKTRGRYYNHSSYNDLIISGLVGLRPRADDVVEVNPLLPENTWDWFCLDKVMYRGLSLTILWDKTGEKYGKGQGLTLFADGKKIANAPSLTRIQATL